MSLRRQKFVSRALAASVIAGLALGASGCAANDTSGGGGEASLRMGTQPWIGYGPWHIADEKGFFADNGVDVSLTNFEADADVNAALASGTLDVANVASHTALQFVENGVDVSIILLLGASTTADAILASGEVTSVADLKGQKVAYEEGTTSDLLLNYALAQNDLSIDDIERVPMGASEAGSALIAKRVPAAVTYEPYITEAVSADADVQVLYTAAEEEGLISDVLVVRNEVLKEKPEALTDLLASWGAAVDFYDANTEEGRAIIATAVGANPDDLTTAFDGVSFVSLADNKTELGGHYSTTVLPKIVAAATEAKILTGTVDPAAVVNADLLT